MTSATPGMGQNPDGLVTSTQTSVTPNMLSFSGVGTGTHTMPVLPMAQQDIPAVSTNCTSENSLTLWPILLQLMALHIQLFRERLSEKKHKSARDKTETTRQREFAGFLSLQTCRNKVLLVTLNFRRIFKTQKHATVEVKLQKKAT